MSNIDTLLDSNLDDLADLPEFAVFPSGTHKVTVKFSEKEINNNPYVEMGMKVVETVELANPAEDTPLKPGTEGSCLFSLTNEFGQGSLKKILSVFAAACGTASLRDTMAAADGMEVCAVVKTKADKKDPSVMRMNVNKVFFE